MKLGLIIFNDVNKININKKIKLFLCFDNNSFTLENLIRFKLK